MADEKEAPARKQIKAFFTGDEDLPTHYVNMVNVRVSLDDFFLTLGTIIPTDIADGSDELEDLDSIKAHPLFRCAMPRSVAKDFIKLLTQVYESQTARIDELQDSQGRDD